MIENFVKFVDFVAQVVERVDACDLTIRNDTSDIFYATLEFYNFENIWVEINNDNEYKPSPSTNKPSFTIKDTSAIPSKFNKTSICL